MISIIVPVYKVEPYIHKSINSILSQTYQDIEILLIDDGSPDKCGEICDEYAKLDNRIRVFHILNQGLSAARNIGIKKARGQYIGFVDSDDWIEPNMYEVLLRRIEETGADISSCGVWCEYWNSRYKYSISNEIYTGIDATKALIYKLSNGAWNKLYKKSCWTNICFPENHLYEDTATLYKVTLNVSYFSCVSDPLYHYRMRAGSIVHTKSMKNYMDYWNAFFNRFLYLCLMDEFKNDHVIMDCMEKQVAYAALSIWLLSSKTPKKQRDYLFLNTVSDSVCFFLPKFGKKTWGNKLRIVFFFCRYTNDISFMLLKTLSFFYSFIKSVDNKTLFPNY